MKKVTIIIIIFISAVVFSCTQQLYMPASSDVTQQQQLLAGRKLYVTHCGACHNLHLPKQYTAEVWEKNLDEMQPKAKITNEEKQLIFKYLTSQP